MTDTQVVREWDPALERMVTRMQAEASGSSQSWRRIGPFTYRYFDTIYVAVTADGGTFTLTVNGETTAAIAFDASLADILTAIIALPGVTSDDVGFDDGPGNIGFALGFLDEPVTADGTSLTGVGAGVAFQYSDRVVALRDLAGGEFIDNALCVRVEPFDDTGPALARITDSSAGAGDAPHWSLPWNGGDASASAWVLNAVKDLTNFYGPGGDNDSRARTGARQVSYASGVGPEDWYVTAPAQASGAATVYLYVFNQAGDGTAGEVGIYLDIVTAEAAA